MCVCERERESMGRALSQDRKLLVGFLLLLFLPEPTTHFSFLENNSPLFRSLSPIRSYIDADRDTHTSVIRFFSSEGR